MHDSESQADVPMSRRPAVVDVMDPMVVEIMRKKTPQERLKMAFGMWDSARLMIQAHLQTEHPEWGAEQVQQEIARRMQSRND